MSSKRITISVEAHKRLKDAKKPGDSFSDVILRHVRVHKPCATAGELLVALRSMTLKPMNPIRLARLNAERGRLSGAD